MNEIDRQYHEASNIFPLMDGDEYEQLKADIAKNGLREPIWIDADGKIIDGRNRHRACIDTGTPEQFRTWNGNGSLINFVISLNLHRRHLEKGQRAAIALDVLPMLEKEAKANTRTHTEQGYQRIENPVHAHEQAADLFQTNRQYVADAKNIKEKAPDLFERVKTGEITIPQAKREIVKAERIETPDLPSNKYRVLYADPPWKYGNSGSGIDNYGPAERHYPAMSIEELCELPIKEIVEPDAVLFLWVTSPLLEECFDVIRAWGFKYKTSFVWDKIGHNFGHYNSVRHEFLLVCTRGSCTPDNLQLFDSVVSIEKSKTHSEKPEIFRNIIDTLYTRGKKIELFARANAKGWEVWGNEPTIAN